MAKMTDEGENWVLDVLFDDEAVAANLYLGIYTDGSEPVETDSMIDISELAVANGYARIALARGTWTLAADLASYAEQTFTASGGDWGSCTGAFITTDASGTAGKLLYVESFGTPRTINDGDSLLVTPKVRAA